MRINFARVCLAVVLGALTHLACAAKLGIIVSNVDQAGIQCGITKSAIEGRVKMALRAAGISVIPSSEGFASWIHVSYGFLAAPEACVASMNVQIVTATKIPAEPEFKPSNGLGQLLVCTSNNIVSLGKDEFETRFLNAVEESTKDCLGRADYK